VTLWSDFIWLRKRAYEYRNKPSVSIKGESYLDSVSCASYKDANPLISVLVINGGLSLEFLCSDQTLHSPHVLLIVHPCAEGGRSTGACYWSDNGTVPL
jgi:hypothetical protein